MLISFKIRNVLSYKDLTEFSMVAGSTHKKDDRLVDCKKFKLLKFSSVFGANASGKSNLIYAFHIMKSIVLSDLDNSIDNDFFSYNDHYYKMQDINQMDTSYFEVILLINSKTYSYGFEVDFLNKKFVSEWLHELNDNKEILLFERDTIEKEITFGKSFTKNKSLSQKLNLYKDDIINNETTLLLNFLNTDKPSLYEFDEAKIIHNLFSWFYRSLDIADPHTMITSGKYFDIQKKLDALSEILNYFDTGIIKIDKVKVSYEDVKRDVDERFIKSIIDRSIKKMKSDEKIEVAGNLIRFNRNFWIIKVTNSGEITYEKIIFYHEKDRKYEFILSDQSDGTIRILDLAGILITDEQNKTFVVDELDRCLHPQLTCKFVKMFLEKAKEEKNHNQLIVTTHESRLLDFDILRRDEIWFVEKKEGSSKLYSLEEYDVRFDKKIDNAYLEGRYGGVPIFDKIFPHEFMKDEDQNIR